MTAERIVLLNRLRDFPAALTALVGGLSETERMAHPEGEWTVAQNVHHLADAHMNGYVRIRLALTEDHPTIHIYKQAQWAELPDYATADISASLAILHALHRRWLRLLESLSEAQWARTVFHPGRNGDVNIDGWLEIYANHGEAHLKQIREALATVGK
ncbi:MAG TPA: DinB family protein [Aggregatilineales bacterium]|nr:DinB family protein [Anaerolineales bacterium]HRE48969.1 DinB family protein [Aggregatilineales bacterium]